MEKVLEMDSPGPAMVLIGTSPERLCYTYKKTASGISMKKNIDYSLKYMQCLCFACVGGEWE